MPDVAQQAETLNVILRDMKLIAALKCFLVKSYRLVTNSAIGFNGNGIQTACNLYI